MTVAPLRHAVRIGAKEIRRDRDADAGNYGRVQRQMVALGAPAPWAPYRRITEDASA